MKPVFNRYKNSFKDVIESNIDNKISSKNNFLQLLKPSVLTL